VKDDATIAAETSSAVLPVEEHSDDPTNDEEEVLVKKISLADALNCAETLLEFLEQESDSNFSDILTLRKLHTSIKVKRSTYGGINRSFSGRLRLSVIFYYPANGNRSLARLIEVRALWKGQCRPCSNRSLRTLVLKYSVLSVGKHLYF
jgi:hypothetical protein